MVAITEVLFLPDRESGFNFLNDALSSPDGLGPMFGGYHHEEGNITNHETAYPMVSNDPMHPWATEILGSDLMQNVFGTGMG